ncbi:thiamine kinase-like enzyme [Streptohalobacillus salinus]|uniref:Thiamine kinase-like enzyme n=1 Tax=Streptohalobacillus salinus TaxID=621096 RepID=A0A2V3W7G5_9BACI|nr:phosphotransferase family protein [Streptohalobacillus salinus]PXW88185.1 thiamine kinase-like enzyme [Streptohalobacillus salinus]
MQHILGDDWIIESAGGSTGEAYYAQSKHKRLFLKRNSSPFLAVLSAQGIVPKLVWTKRMENGDVITAQEWLDGNELNPEVLQHPKVAELLGRIHHSAELLDMLTRIGKKPLQPAALVKDLRRDYQTLANEKLSLLVIERALEYMETHLHIVEGIKPVVCHCDLNHNNWMITDRGELYLIDWDNAEIADPAIDLSLLFKRYIPREDWDKWLAFYGEVNDEELTVRMYWYMFYELLTSLNHIQTVTEQTEKLEELQEILNQAMKKRDIAK